MTVGVAAGVMNEVGIMMEMDDGGVGVMPSPGMPTLSPLNPDQLHEGHQQLHHHQQQKQQHHPQGNNQHQHQQINQQPIQFQHLVQQLNQQPENEENALVVVPVEEEEEEEEAPSLPFLEQALAEELRSRVPDPDDEGEGGGGGDGRGGGGGGGRSGSSSQPRSREAPWRKEDFDVMFHKLAKIAALAKGDGNLNTLAAMVTRVVLPMGVVDGWDAVAEASSDGASFGATLLSVGELHNGPPQGFSRISDLLSKGTGTTPFDSFAASMLRKRA